MIRFGGEPSPEELEIIAYEEAVSILAKIVETGPALDPQKLAALRAQLQQYLGQLGTLDDYGNLDSSLWAKAMVKIVDLTTFGKKPEGYPTMRVFSKAYSELNQDEIKDIKPRGDRISPAEYLYGLGIIMASQPTYESVFKEDPIVIKRGTIQNGRHRNIALQVLNGCGVNTSGWHWIKREIED